MLVVRCSVAKVEKVISMVCFMNFFCGVMFTANVLRISGVRIFSTKETTACFKTFSFLFKLYFIGHHFVTKPVISGC